MTTTQCTDKRIIANRPAHALNDAHVRLLPGRRAPSRFASGADAINGAEGHVWAVDAASGKAVVYFASERGPISCVAAIADLEVLP